MAGWQSLGGSLTAEPVAVSGRILDEGGIIEVFAQGQDGALWHIKGTIGFVSTPPKWSKWESLGGKIISKPSPVFASNGVYVFALGTDGALWYRFYGGGDWGAWKSLGGKLTSDPSATSEGPNVRVFAKGTDNGLWFIEYKEGPGGLGTPSPTWSTWTPLGGKMTSNPVTGGLSNHVFARGTDNALWHIESSDGHNWSGWRSLGGTITSNLSVTAFRNVDGESSRILVFARGMDGALSLIATSNGRDWGKWQSLGGKITSDPSAVSPFVSIRILDIPNLTHVFARGTDNATWYRKSEDGTSWKAWKSAGGNVTSNLTVVCDWDGRLPLHVFARGADNALWHLNESFL